MTDDTDFSAVDFRQRLQQVYGPHVIPNSLHRSTGIPLFVRIDMVIAEIRVIGRKGYITSLGQLLCIVKVFRAAEPRWLCLSNLHGLMKAENGRRLYSQR